MGLPPMSLPIAFFLALIVAVLALPVVNSSGHRIQAGPPTAKVRARNANGENIRHILRQQCKPEGLDVLDGLSSFKCKTLQDLISEGTSTALSGLKSLSGQDMRDEQLNDIQANFIGKMVDGMNDKLLNLSPSGRSAKSLLDSNICLGNFREPAIFENFEGVCGNLPLRGEWSVFGFSLDIGVGSPFHAACPSEKGPLGTHASFCIAINVDKCSKIPSFVLSVTPKLLKCAPFSQILGSSTGGASVAVIEAVDSVFDSVTWGTSLTNSFEEEFKTFSGDKIISDFTHRGTFYTAAAFALDASTIGVPSFFSFSGDAVKMQTVDGNVAQTKSVLTQLTKNPKSSAEALMKTVTSLKFSILYKMDLKMAFAFSELKSKKNGGMSKNSLAMALPDSDPFTIGTATVFANTYTVKSQKNDRDRLVPGMYMYSSASPISAVKALLKYALQFVGSILDFLPNWVPIDLDISSSNILDFLDPSGSSSGDFAIAMATQVTNARADIFLKFPLLLDVLGFLEIKCTVDIDHESFKCSVKTNFGEDIFGAIGEALEEGVLFVARKLDALTDDVGDATKEIIAAGVSTLGDAADKFGSAFSKTTTKATAEALQAGKIALSELGDVKYEVQAWATKVGGKFEDVLDDIGDGIEDGIKEIGNAGEKAIDEIEDAYNDAVDKFEPLVRGLETAFDCSVDAIANAMTGKGTQCSGLNQLTKTFKSVGRDINKAFDKVEDTFKDVGREIENALKQAGKVFGFGKQRREKVFVKNSPSARNDRNTSCRLFNYYKEIVTEKRTCVIVCGKWKRSSTKRVTIGLKPMDSCVMAILKQIDNALDEVQEVESRKKAAERAAQFTKSCSAARRTSIANLRGQGLKCTTVFQTEKGKIGFVRVFEPCKRGRFFGICARPPRLKTVKALNVPTTVTCTVPTITVSGSYGSRVSVTKSGIVSFLDNGVYKRSIDSFEGKVKDEIVSKISGSCNPK